MRYHSFNEHASFKNPASPRGVRHFHIHFVPLIPGVRRWQQARGHGLRLHVSRQHRAIGSKSAVLERLAEKLILRDDAAVKQYSADLRERLLGAIDAGLPQTEAARLFGVGTSTIKRWQRRRRQTGSVAAFRRPGRRRRIGPEAEAALIAQVRAAPDATLAEHCAVWAAATSVQLSEATMSRALRRAGWLLKKSRWSPRNGTRRPEPRGALTPAHSTPPILSSSMKPVPTRR
jgi:putative transposase